MANLITGDEAAEICGVTPILFKAARVGVGAPDPIILPVRKPGACTKAYYSEEQYRTWAETHDFWELATEYRYRQRNGDLPRARPARKRNAPDHNRIAKEKEERFVTINPLALRFLRGDFAPAPVRIAQDMKRIRARINKPKTSRVFYQGIWGD